MNANPMIAIIINPAIVILFLDVFISFYFNSL
jgi:hypothetical protein